jgi:hypothetical protein
MSARWASVPECHPSVGRAVPYDPGEWPTEGVRTQFIPTRCGANEPTSSSARHYQKRDEPSSRGRDGWASHCCSRSAASPSFCMTSRLDVVQTDATYEFACVVEPSGRFVFRAWFGDSFHPRQEIADQLGDIGALFEWSSTNLLAVDAADAQEAQIVADFLSDQEDRGHLKYETGRSA